MGYSNGRIPDALLKPIAGGRLTSDAAACWNQMNIEARRMGIEFRPFGPNSSYRTYDKQVEFWNLFQHGGNPAARPGTSNHGFGKAVDLADPDHMRPVFDRIGAKYGWSHAEGARVGEAWHVTYVGGVNGPDPGPDGSAAPPATVTKANAGRHADEVRRIERFLVRAGFLAPGWKVSGVYAEPVRSAVWQFRRACALQPSSTVDAACWERLGRDPYSGLTDAERALVTEYDYLKRTNGPAERRQELRERMTAKRKEIWRAAGADPRGWEPNHRRTRFEILKSRTEETTP